MGHEIVNAVNFRCEAFLQARRAEIAEISGDPAALTDSLLDLTRGGKKLRPLLGWIGWRAAGGDPESAVPQQLGVALELFQAAALVHDDVIDRSATRRGQPAVHIRFESLHRQAGHGGDPARFGISSAILSGDLALSWASQAFSEAQSEAAGHDPAAAAIFHRMHSDVIAGQYLDVLAEVRRPAATENEAVHQARTVLRYKAAKYSTEYPLLLGAALAGGGEALRQALAAAALPLGEAFQLRDDLLGVFGDPDLTGKPVGDDLREGKRTELIAYGLFRSSAPESEKLSAMLGDPDLTEADVALARQILISCGAAAAVESQIQQLAEAGAAAAARLSGLGVAQDVLGDFEAVRQRLVTRTS